MGRISLRRQLHLQAHQGKTPTLIFLSKNVLGYHAQPRIGAAARRAESPKV
jgi:hypothetical protein